MDKFKLTIENENLASWMSINNSHTFKWSDSKRDKKKDARAYWHGVLIQLGRYDSIVNGTVINGFTVIDLYDDFDAKEPLHTFVADDFKDGKIVWINVVGRKRGSKIKKSDPAPRKCVRYLKIGEPLSNAFDRASSLHKYFRPYPGGITLWDDTGYEVQTRIVDRAGTPRAQQEFTLDASGGITVEMLCQMKRKGSKAKEAAHVWHQLVERPARREKATGRIIGADWDPAAKQKLLGSKIRRIEVRQQLAEGQVAADDEIHKNPPQRP